MLVNNVMGLMGAIAMGMAKWAESYELLILGRFMIGVNCGLNTSLVPMYISEIGAADRSAGGRRGPRGSGRGARARRGPGRSAIG